MGLYKMMKLLKKRKWKIVICNLGDFYIVKCKFFVKTILKINKHGIILKMNLWKGKL